MGYRPEKDESAHFLHTVDSIVAACRCVTVLNLEERHSYKNRYSPFIVFEKRAVSV
jgi:hypothetical protein